MSATKTAFDAARDVATLKPLQPHKIGHADECIQMQNLNGMAEWCDGPILGATTASTTLKPSILPTSLDKKLWVVLPKNVMFAPEYCEFGNNLATKKVKHSNLTGGASAYSGGELVFIEGDTLVVNGCSGRYGSETPEEFEAFVLAFRNSGYHVWSMGWDADGDRPMPFGPDPVMVGA